MLTINTMASRVRIFSDELNDSIPKHKRHKTGVNARYDSMVNKMNNTLHSSRSKKRKRTGSSGSSSSNSHETLATPIDSVYDGLSEGRLGKNFGVIKMMAQDATTAPLPDWLSDTFSTLDQDNPLRLLLPDDTASADGTSSGDLHDSSAEEDSVFALWPPPDNFAFVPFSTPGPASHLSVSSPDSSSSASFPPDSIISTALTCHRSPSPIPHAPAQDKVQLTDTDFDEFFLFHSQSPHAQSHAPKLLSPSRFSPKTAILPNLFSAPGPVYYTSHPTYYDSPTRDPSSDPIDLGYQMQDIDFEWQPFVRKDLSLQESSAQPNLLFQFHDQENKPMPQLQPRTPEILQATPEPFDLLDPERCYDIHASASPGPFRFNVPSPSPIIPRQSSPAVFAPEPGIYLSPLRDTRNEGNGVEGKRDSPSCSQSSDDSIESWSV